MTTRWPKWLRIHHLDGEPYTSAEIVIWLGLVTLGTAAFIAMGLLVAHLDGAPQ